MGSLLANTFLCQDDDAVGVADRRQPMSNDQRRPVMGQILQSLLYFPLCLVVQGRRRFVQNKDRRIFKENAGNSQALFLPFRQLDAPFCRWRCRIRRATS